MNSVLEVVCVSSYDDSSVRDICGLVINVDIVFDYVVGDVKCWVGDFVGVMEEF